MARLEPSGTLVLTKEVRRLYDLPVFTAAGTLSITLASDEAHNPDELIYVHQLQVSDSGN
ncbi:hypothetical protein YEP4_19289 [Yersinia enterocolitica subsp. palearctica YE-P4]|nr:hypothetical protein IOK_14845 [Yersinia enterocolitica subsp. palearctica PhRBD_Ye1]EOR65605.1 hypothetical protein YEP4_19289 [Yersinia enterocolitica subsp. palearctica YE-P4]CNB39491.1 Yersinia protein of uncharacterised function (DUF3831) [Yersinia enterocolitica]VEA98451.1 Yersinia protein of uncharacterised function (DUF3831) [Yersinia enterocolitica subsp. enterocolitica]